MKARKKVFSVVFTTVMLLGAVLACDLGRTPVPGASSPLPRPSPVEPTISPTAIPILPTATMTPVLPTVPVTPIILQTSTPAVKFTFPAGIEVPLQTSITSILFECVSVNYDTYCGGITGVMTPLSLEIGESQFVLTAMVKVFEETGEATFPPGGPLNSLNFVIGGYEFSSRGFSEFFANERVVIGEEREGRFFFEGVFPQEFLGDPSKRIILKARWIRNGEYQMR